MYTAARVPDCCGVMPGAERPDSREIQVPEALGVRFDSTVMCWDEAARMGQPIEISRMAFSAAELRVRAMAGWCGAYW